MDKHVLRNVMVHVAMEEYAVVFLKSSDSNLNLSIISRREFANLSNVVQVQIQLLVQQPTQSVKELLIL
jgi:hypothetical protein